MHNLAIALSKKGFVVTGSDDEIFEPAASRLRMHGLQPESNGWFPEKITTGIDRIILGMHARADNPELLRARKLGITINSFPEYLYEQTRNKKRIVVGGSHGKTTITAMIMHALRYNGVRFDYMVGSAIEGYDTMVSLGDDTEIAIFEGDEYLSSAIDRRPKFHLYHPDIAIINGIAWDHMNVFPTMENYTDQFSIFADMITSGGTLAYCEADDRVSRIALSAREDIVKKPYNTHAYLQNKAGVFAVTLNRIVPAPFFGEHNFQNLSAAREACLAAGLPEEKFYDALPSFPGTARRLQLLREAGDISVYLDFAHAPSKVKATIDAVAERYRGRQVLAVLELHTYSSLNINFIENYRGTMDNAHKAFIYFNPHALEIKKLPSVSTRQVADAFRHSSLIVTNNSDELFSAVKDSISAPAVVLFMSSGDFNGCNIKNITDNL